jgi:hypothetical protein
MRRNISVLLWFLLIISNISYLKGQDYVQIINNDFYLSGSKFYPKVLNYAGEIYSPDGVNFRFGPYHEFQSDNRCPCSTIADCNTQLLTQFQKIKSWGFNAIRLCGIGMEGEVDDGDLCFRYTKLASDLSPITSIKVPLTTSNYATHIALVSNVLTVAANAGLKVILLMGPGSKLDTAIVKDKYAAYLSYLSNYFKNDSRILAYDLYNEYTGIGGPAVNTDKLTIKGIVNNWCSSIKTKTNNLVTVGPHTFFALRDWDWGIFNVDFISFHFYPYGNTFLDQSEISYNNRIEGTERELYWLYSAVKKPWIVGETGFPASDAYVNDWGTEADQKNYANFSYYRTCDCGSKGYSWWDYKEVMCASPGIDTYGRTFGLIHCDNSEKLAVSEFTTILNQSAVPAQDKSHCIKPTSYYNFAEVNNYCLSGTVLGDLNGKNLPIENAFILGFYYDPITKTYPCFVTFSDENGNFTLCSDQIITGFEVIGVGSTVEHPAINYNSPSIIYLDCNGFPASSSISGTVEIGSTNNFSPAGRITITDLTVKGNGSTGGNSQIDASNSITITKLSAQKGSNVKINIKPNYHDCQVYGQKSTAETNNSSVMVNLSDTTENLDVNFFPNPSNGEISIDIANFTGSWEVIVLNIMGNIVAQEHFSGNHCLLDLTDMPRGLYILKIKTNKSTLEKKIILN